MGYDRATDGDDRSAMAIADAIGMKRPELNAAARVWGVDPSILTSKEALLVAILTALADRRASQRAAQQAKLQVEAQKAASV